ncbi:MAG: vitamin K epoxide reductase family protein, partial [Myxococcales bacterium]
LFQIRWLGGLACPAFGSGCESVALAPFANPFGVADGLLGAAWCGLICALAQVPRREAAALVVALACMWLLVNAVGVLQMQQFGAFCFWCILTAVLSLPLAALAIVVARQAAAPTRVDA